jgi:type VI secretion system protein ImpA
MEGFQGFNRGMSLLSALCEKFWDDIYPLVDWENRNFIPRLAQFYFLAEKIPERIVLIPLLKPTDTSDSHGLSDWMEARRNFQIKNSKGLSLGQIKKSIPATPVEYVESLAAELRVSTENLKKLDEFIVERCGDEAPSFRLLLDYLTDAERITEKNLRIKQTQMAESAAKAQAAADRNADPPPDDDDSEPAQQSSKEPTVEEAYNLLRNIGVFLEKKQPQSPAAILIKIASAIGKKNFQELLDINVKGGAPVMSTISDLYRVLITDRPPEQEE